MKIKILLDGDGAYGYPVGVVMDAQEMIDDYIDNLNEVEDADTIRFLEESPTEIAVDFVAEMWSIDYDFV